MENIKVAFAVVFASAFDRFSGVLRLIETPSPVSRPALNPTYLFKP
jgi:hypothetical protein